MNRSKSAVGFELFGLNFPQMLNFGSVMPSESTVLPQIQKQAHFAETLELFDVCDLDRDNFNLVSKLNPGVFNQRQMALLHNARKLNSVANRSKSQVIFNEVKEKEKKKLEEQRKHKMQEIASRQLRKAQRDKIRAIRFEKKRMDELRNRMDTVDTVKADGIPKNYLGYEDVD